MKTKIITKPKPVPVLAADGRTFLASCNQAKARLLIKSGRAVIFPLKRRYAIRLLKLRSNLIHGRN
jgi:hypothetical protein